MATLPPENSNTKFIPHPAGRHLGVLADVYSLERLNNFYGKEDTKTKEKDERKTTWSVFFVFLTDCLTADGKPSYIRQEYGFSYGDNSKLKKMLLAWIHDLRHENLWKFDLDRILGTGADLSTSIRPNRDPSKSGYAQIDGIMAPRATDMIPEIPADFKRANAALLQQKEDERTKAKFPEFIVRLAAKPADDDFLAGMQEPATKSQRAAAEQFSEDDNLPFA